MFPNQINQQNPNSPLQQVKQRIIGDTSDYDKLLSTDRSEYSKFTILTADLNKTPDLRINDCVVIHPKHASMFSVNGRTHPNSLIYFGGSGWQLYKSTDPDVLGYIERIKDEEKPALKPKGFLENKFGYMTLPDSARRITYNEDFEITLYFDLKDITHIHHVPGAIVKLLDKRSSKIIDVGIKITQTKDDISEYHLDSLTEDCYNKILEEVVQYYNESRYNFYFSQDDKGMATKLTKYLYHVFSGGVNNPSFSTIKSEISNEERNIRIVMDLGQHLRVTTQFGVQLLTNPISPSEMPPHQIEHQYYDLFEKLPNLSKVSVLELCQEKVRKYFPFLTDKLLPLYT